MAKRTTQHSSEVPRKRLILLTMMIIALIGTLAIGSWGKSSKWSPELALDLQGGTQIILTPVTTDNSEITQSDINQAIEVIRQRVDASGVAEAEISSQGGKNIIVGLPGRPSDETLRLVRTSAVMRMRPVLQYFGQPQSLTPAIVSEMDKRQKEAQKSANPSASPSASASSSPSASQSPTPDPKATYSTEQLKKVAKEKADLNHDGKISDKPDSRPSNASDTKWITEKTLYDAYVLDCTKQSSKLDITDEPSKALVACDRSKEDQKNSKEGQKKGQQVAKYILGPSEIEGTQLTKASSGYDQQRGQWVVQIQFDSKGTKAFADVTKRIIKLQQPQNQFAVVLDGSIISTAVPSEVISGGQAQISGSFTDKTAATLANQLSFGSLPLKFNVQSEEQISATLGSESLQGGLLAGGIGVILLAVYLLWTYHGLGIVAIGSIALATGLSYLIVALMSWTIGYRLSMAGVVGFIISIGITADSFIVFFERIRDEIREGRSVRAAVKHGWHRAKRTIYVADGTNLLCSLVLYFLAVGSVRGFAFTLGLTTILDLIVVVMFTYPIMAILVRGKFFGEGHRWSGMSAIALGSAPAYRGRGSVRPRNDRHVDVKLVLDQESSTSSAIDTAVVVTEYSDDAEVTASDSREEQSGFGRRSSGRMAKAGGDAKIRESEGGGSSSTDDTSSSGGGTRDREELSEEEKGLSLAERKALRRRKARQAAHGNAARGSDRVGVSNPDGSALEDKGSADV